MSALHAFVSRRLWLRSLAIPLGTALLGRGLKAEYPGDGSCQKELESLFLRLQAREIEEKAALFRKLVSRYGTALLEEARQFVEDAVRDRFLDARLAGRDLDAVMELLWDKTGATHRFDVLERRPRRLRLRVTRCFYAEEMRRHDAADIGFALYCSYDYGFCRGLNPDIKFQRTRTLMTGDSFCDHVYELNGV